MKHRDDSGGYTLQTIIVSAILLVVATTASVALYRAITTSADVRSIADLRSDTDERTPTEPHSFTVDYKIEGSQYIATINWSNPLYTGTPQLSSSASSLRYETPSGYCQLPLSSDPSNGESPPSTSTATTAPTPTTTTTTTTTTTLPLTPDTLTYPDRKAASVRVTIPSTHDLDCKLLVQAYDCPPSNEESPMDPDCQDEDERANQRIFGPEVEFDFTLRRAASAPQNLWVRVVGSNLLASWDTPENIGSGEKGETLFYEVVWETKPPTPRKCTYENFDSVPANETTGLTVTSYVTPPGEDRPASTEDRCPAALDSYLTLAGDQMYNNSIAGGQLVSDPTLTISPATQDDIGNSDLLNAVSLVQAGRLDDIVTAKIAWDEDENADSFLFQWYRADGIGESRSLEVDNLDEQRIFLRLENGVAYNFSLWARNSIGESEPSELCTAVGSHSTRPLKPDIHAQIIEADILVRIANPNYAASCNPESYCSPTDCKPRSPDYYRLRITETCPTDYSTDNKFPQKECSGDPIYCLPASQGITEVILPSPSNTEKKTIEVISSTQDLCSVNSEVSQVVDNTAQADFELDTSLPDYTTYP